MRSRRRREGDFNRRDRELRREWRNGSQRRRLRYGRRLRYRGVGRLRRVEKSRGSRLLEFVVSSQCS